MGEHSKDQSHPSLTFGPFFLDLRASRLLRGSAEIDLRRKAMGVLRHLITRPGALVTADDLYSAVWDGVAVSPQTLTNVISELRTALDDDAKNPRWIENVYGEGYRFVGRVESVHETTTARQPAGAGESGHPFVGRRDALALLADAFAAASAGTRRTVFISGDAGIGKTSLINAFLESLHADQARTARGECLEHHGVGEAYMPLLAALEGLAKGPHGNVTSLALQEFAPTWRVQLPWLLEPAEHALLERSLKGTTSVRMLREGAVLFDQLGASVPLILLVEDIHWCDAASLDLLNALTRRRDSARLLILATYRHGDALDSQHDVVGVARNLVQRAGAEAIALPPFDQPTVEEYLADRLKSPGAASELAPRVVGHSAGNPLFVRTVTEQIIRQLAEDIENDGAADASSGANNLRLELPETLRDLVHTELDRLDEDVRILVEVASLADLRFSAETIAEVLEREVEQVESNLVALSRTGRLFRRHAPFVWDSAAATRFSFVHGSYARIVRDSIALGRRQSLHGRLAAVLAAAHDDRLHEVAGNLAGHFEEAGDWLRNVDYLALAAENAENRFAYREAAQYLRTALERLPNEQGNPEVDQREAILALRLGSVLMLSFGYSEPEIEQTFRRAELRCEALGELNGLFMSRVGLAVNAMTRARFDLGVRHAKALLESAASAVPDMATLAGLYAGYAASSLGTLDRAHEVLTTALAHDVAGSLTYYNPRRMVRAQLATVLTVMGRLEEGRAASVTALETARNDGRPAELAHAALFATDPAVMRRDRTAGRASVDLAIESSQRNGFPTFEAMARFYRAWLEGDDACGADIAGMRAALEHRRALGDRWHESMMLALLAEAELARGAVAEARSFLEEARRFMNETGEGYYEAEIMRLAGDCALAHGSTPRALETYAAARKKAEEQGAGLWELRIATSQAQALAHSGDRIGAAGPLRAAMKQFDPLWPDTDVQAARRVLASLGS